MANTIKIKRSAVPAKVPTTGDLDLGELALNTYDGKLYTKKDDGTASVVEIGAGGGGSSTLTISAKTGAYTVVAGDLGTIINCTGGTSFTVALTAAATLGSGFNCWIWNTSNTAADAITINPNGAETIDGVATLILRRGEGTQIVCDGTNFQTGDKKTMRGYAENFADGTSRPSAPGSSAIAIGGSATASGAQAFAAGGWAIASGTASISIGGYNANATASATYGTSFGSNSGGNGSQAVTGAGAMALGGSYASGADSFAAGIANNTATYGATANNAICISYLGKASGSRSLSIGGFGNIASATGSAALAGGANGAQATGTNAVAIGDGTRAIQAGKYAYSGGLFSSSADSQTGTFVLRRATTDATATVLTTDNSAPGTDDQIILPNNSAYAFHGTIVARQQASGGTASAAWKIEGLIRREANAASTVLVNSATTVLDNTPAWGMALSADTTNGGLKIEVTGAAATNIRWVATINTSEVTY
jgi:hypothetical protein